MMQAAQPIDIRLMNATATVLFAAVAAAFAWTIATWVARQPLFLIRSVNIETEVHRTSAATIRANAAPRLNGNLFTVDLQQSERAFEAVPWVRRAQVRRVWPNALAVRIEEHQPAALWGESRLLNTYGEVFEANTGAVEDDDLPVLSGPDESSQQVLTMYRNASEKLKRLGVRIERLILSERGSWHIDLDTGAQIELGRGQATEIMDRLDRFVGTWARVSAQYPGPLEYADLRHRDGYAVRIRGISVSVPKDAKRN